MSVLTKNPSDINFLSPLGIKFVLKRAPNVVYFVQKFEHADISMEEANVPTPFAHIPLPGNVIVPSVIRVTFKVDENFTNYLEIYNWLTGLGHPDSLQQHQDLSEGDGVLSDLSLIVMDSTFNPNYEFVYKHAFPVSLSGLNFDTTDTEVNYVSATATFKFEYYDLNSIT